MSWLVKAVLAVVAGYTGLAIAVRLMHRKIIYMAGFPEGSRSQVDSPKSMDLPFTQEFLETRDGVKLHVYTIIPNPKSNKTVVILGPNAGNMGHSLPIANLIYRQMHYNVVLLSYRGYGKSTGSPSEEGIQIDIDTCLEYISSHSALKDSSIVLYGRSLGGAVAIYGATTKYARQGNPPPVAGIILENTFLSIPSLVSSVMAVATPFKWAISDTWNSLGRIACFPKELPVLFLGGGRDELIPPWHFAKLYETCPSQLKTFKTYPNGTHNDTLAQDNYWEDFYEFLHSQVSPRNE